MQLAADMATPSCYWCVPALVFLFAALFIPASSVPPRVVSQTYISDGDVFSEIIDSAQIERDIARRVIKYGINDVVRERKEGDSDIDATQIKRIESDDDTIDTKDPYRLDDSVIPIQYTLHLEPDIEKEVFTGMVNIEVTANKPVEIIKLHADKITIVGDVEVSHLNAVGGSTNLFKEVLTGDDYDNYTMIGIQLNDALEENQNYSIVINYESHLRDDMYGFYVSSYNDGKERKLAATQFEPTHARKAFPCFDEPSFKARFQVNIVVSPPYHCLSNMPTRATLREGEKVNYIFENSLKMSTYLLAFVVSEFVSDDDPKNVEEDAVKIRTWARPNAIDRAAYSVQVTRPMLEVLQNYTKINFIDPDDPHPLNKIDQVALPDFSAGAMENWGLITYRETALLFNDGSADAKKRVATVIAHELLHVWFGNLVTCAWWSVTWLNEGFARYFQYYVTDKVETDWRMWDQFVVDQHQMVMALDSLVTVQALTHPVSTPAQASASFGTISYSKGGSVLRMISYTMGEENFQKALQQYLKDNVYDYAEPEDLFAAFGQYASSVHLDAGTFEKFLRSWTEQPGFPEVKVIRNYQTNSCTISQKRFLYKGSSSEQYIVPITWTQEGGSFEIREPDLYLQQDSTLDINGLPSADKWVIFNVQETGYYRVNYDKDNWALLAEYLNDYANRLDAVHVLNRAQLLDDAFNLARAGQLPYATAFALSDYLRRETDYVPWAAALTAFAHLNRMLLNHDKYPVFQRYVLRLLGKSYGKWQHTFVTNQSPEDHIEKLLMNKISTWACALGHKECLGHAVLKFRDYLGKQRIDPEQRSIVFCYALQDAPASTWEDAWEMYKSSDDDVERGLLMNGLACSTSETLLKRLLLYSIESPEIRKQDASSVFSAVYANPSGVTVALEFLDENFEQVRKYYGSMGSINNIVTGIAGRLTTEDQKKTLQDFVTKWSEYLGSTGDAAIETVDENLLWMTSYGESILEVLEDKELRQYRIPDWVTPNHYDVFLEPFITTKSFLGRVTIDVVAQTSTDTIILHGEEIDPNETPSVKRSASGDNEELVRSVSKDRTHEFLTIHLNKQLVVGENYIITISFAGRLRDNMYGFYISTYTNESGQEVTLLATQFQPTHARKAFPCFDEPRFKATFTITIRTPANYGALGNMPTERTQPADGSTTDVTFKKTPMMSTYLIAFVVSDFVYMEDSQKDVVFRTWARSNAIQWAEYSINVSRPILETLEDFTGIAYKDSSQEDHFDKVDQVALPDFSAGAMENWGLVTYRETALLYNAGTAAARKSVATIIAHELTHMWFGNLVTTRWWDATWLNEAFAQYFQFVATSRVKPLWRLMDQFLVDHHQAVMAADALAAAAALTAPAFTPAQVSARFGTITYSKGAAVLRMLHAVMGDKKFLDALHSYLSAYRYKSTVPDNLFQHLLLYSDDSNLAQNEFLQLLHSWTEQPGFPVVTVARNYDTGAAIVSQTRFLLKNPANPDTKLYYVPLTWVAEGDNFTISSPRAYLKKEQSSTVTGLPDREKWVIFNVQDAGYYRVNYDERNWQLLTSCLLDADQPLDAVHVLNRAQLLDDAFNLARAGQLPYATAFALSDYLRRETDYVPWAAALTAFAYLQRMLVHHQRYPAFEEYVRHLLEVQYDLFGFEDREEHVEKLLLSRVSAWACSLRHAPCTDAAAAALRLFLDDGETVPADLRSVVYCYGVRHSSDEYWYKMLEEYKKSLDNTERGLLMSGLACTHEEDRLKELLAHSISGEFIRQQDASNVFSSVYANSVGVEVALDFLDENFEAVETYYGSMGAINNIVVGIAGRLTTAAQRAKLQRFVDTHADSLDTVGDAALETADENLEWLSRNEEVILDLLDRPLVTFPTEAPPTTLAAGSVRAAIVIVAITALALRFF